MTRLLPIALLVIVAIPATVFAQNDRKDVAFFESKIRPILVQHCYKCHAADAKNVRGGLLLDTRAGSLTGGDSGPAVVPGKIDESLIISSLKYEDYEMPPSGKLPDVVIADFEKWIAMGAADPRDGKAAVLAAPKMDIEKGREFWAFQKPSSNVPSVPDVKSTDWPRGDIDRFTLAAMETAGVVPATDADRRTLLRRVYFDLIGLPPSPAAIGAFLHDESDHAFESVVDELLSSRHFGERWGRHWLDVARYSDSTGGGRSLLFKVAWRYRNYVIDAFNNDTPFDQFIIEQIAGDLLTTDDNIVRSRQLTATGFLAMGPTNYENQDKRQLRMDVVDEQIDTIGRAFLGMTIGCARCHDHKFDPIPTTDYYAMAGIFRSTQSLVDGNVSNWITRPLPVAGDGTLGEEIKTAKSKLATSEKVLAELRKRMPSVTIDDDKATLTGKWVNSTFTKSFVGKRYVHTSDRTARAVYAFKIPRDGKYRVGVSYTPGENREKAAPFTIRRGEQVLKVVRLNQRKSPRSQFVSLGEFDLQTSLPVTVLIDAAGTSDVVIADAVRLEYLGGSELDGLKQKLLAAENETRKHQQQLAALKKQAAVQASVMSVKEEAKPEDFHVAIRGNVRKLGEKVPRGFLSVASDEPASIPTGASGRLEFARWIASPDNPLTARVAANRVWHHLFGSGLVRTVDNFGVPGERPSNPQLLDHLAIRFVAGGWSTQKLIRSIVLSRTYQLSSSASTHQKAADPENQLFARQNLRRLQAETLRDSLYSLSGELDLAAVENSVRGGTKNEYGYQFASRHRSVYLPVFRNRLHDMFSVFDFPDPNLSNGRRNVSTLSTQALYLMNSPLVLEQSQKAARKLLAQADLTDEQRVVLLYESAIGRLPTQRERQLSVSFVTVVNTADREDQWAGVCQALIGSVDFRYVR